MIAHFLKSYSRRKWLYAFGEMLSFSTTALCAYSVIGGERYEIGADHGMARFTAACVGALALIVFIVLAILREQDDKV